MGVPPPPPLLEWVLLLLLPVGPRAVALLVARLFTANAAVKLGILCINLKKGGADVRLANSSGLF